VEVAQMKFNRVFFKSDDFITAMDANRNLICCASYSGRIVVYDFVKRTQMVENRLKLQKRSSSTSDTDTFETPHVSALAFSHDGCHLLCGLENGSLVVLEPNVLHEIRTLHVSQERIEAIRFSPDSSFVTLYVSSFRGTLSS
jgi:WD40 repeat protein